MAVKDLLASFRSSPSLGATTVLSDLPREGPEASDFSENFWATREAQNPAWVQGFWNGRNGPARQAIGSAIAALPAQRVLEVGVHCGVNLWATGQKRKFDWLAGVDISRHVLEAGQRLMAANLSNPHALLYSHADDLPFPDKSFDVSLASVALVCVGPDKIEQVLREMIRVTKGHIVLAEPYDTSPELATPEGRIDPYPNTTYWIRNYAGLIAKLQPGAHEISVVKLSKEDSLGHLDSVQVIAL